MKKGIKGIYLIERIETFPCEKKYYVGQAIDIFRRLNDHCTQNNPGIDNAISELGSDKFSFRILEIVHHAEDLDTCESKWINYYKELYGDEQMYNIAQTTNSRTTIDSQIKAQIKKLFEEELGRSIYAIAEYFDISHEDVIKIRKPLLSKHGLTWKKGKIVNKLTELEPNNWKGGLITKKMAKDVDSILAIKGNTEKDIRFISQSDLTLYLDSKEVYEFASEIKNIQ